jgi:ribonuclease J
MIIVVAQVGRGGKPGRIDIVSRGFTFIEQQQQLMKELKRAALTALSDKEPRTSPNESYLRDKLRIALEKFIFYKTHRQPLILPVIVEA